MSKRKMKREQVDKLGNAVGTFARLLRFLIYLVRQRRRVEAFVRLKIGFLVFFVLS